MAPVMGGAQWSVAGAGTWRDVFGAGTHGRTAREGGERWQVVGAVYIVSGASRREVPSSFVAVAETLL